MDNLLLHPDGIGYKYSMQLCVANCQLSAEEVGNYIDQHFWGNCLNVSGDGKLMKIGINTNKPWEILEYCDGLGELVDITIENRTL